MFVSLAITQAMFVVAAKRTSMLDKQNSKCFSRNVCPAMPLVHLAGASETFFSQSLDFTKSLVIRYFALFGSFH